MADEEFWKQKIEAEKRLEKDEGLIIRVIEALSKKKYKNDDIIPIVSSELQTGSINITRQEHDDIAAVTDALHEKFRDMDIRFIGDYVSRLASRIERHKKIEVTTELRESEEEAERRVVDRIKKDFKIDIDVVSKKPAGKRTESEQEAWEVFKKERDKIRGKRPEELAKTQYEDLLKLYESKYIGIEKYLQVHDEKLNDEQKAIKHEFLRELHKTHEKIGEKTGFTLPKVTVPKVVKKPVVGAAKIFGGIVAVVIGFALSALLGIQLFVWAFLFFAIYVVLPGGPEFMAGTVKKMEALKEGYEPRIRKLEAEGKLKEAAELAEVLRAEIEAEKSLGEAKLSEVRRKQQGYAYAALSIRKLAKIIGIAFILFGIGTSGFPLAPLIALAGGFIAYFSFTFGRSISKEEEK